MRIPEPAARARAFPGELSGGMCQRVMIAIALAGNPALLIADEPTTGLDTTTQASILDLIVGHARERSMATLLITHDLALARAYAERIVVMHAGQIVEEAPTEALFAAPRHPYSAALIGATPADAADISGLAGIAGSLPDLATQPPACRFADRCARAIDRCRSERPPLDPRRRPPRRRLLGAAMTALLEAIALRKLFPVGKGRMLHAVDGVDLTLGEGESLGIVGESGSGKSTLARLVVRLIDADDGTIRFAGRDIGAVPSARFARDPARRAIQLVFQSSGDAMNPAFSTARNIALGRGHMRLDAATMERVKAIAAEVNLGAEHLTRRPHQLSGGQQARAGIARALISEPKLLVLDEPTASLDVSVQATVLSLIDALRRRHGIALLFVSHDLDVVRLMCDRVMVLYLGRVAETGPAAAVLRAPRHPYTRALVAATPGHGHPRALPGEPVSPIDPPAEACLFASRCALAVDRCRHERPRLRTVGDSLVACHRAEERAWPTRRSVNLRRVDPDDAGDRAAGVAVAVGQVGLEEERVARLHVIDRAVDIEFDLAFQQIADRLALMGDRVVLHAAGLDVVDVRLEQVAGGERHQPLVEHALAAAQRVTLDLHPVGGRLHQLVLVDLEAEEGRHVAIERRDDLVEHDQRGRHLARLDLGNHAFVAADFLGQVAHAHALEDARMADPCADLKLGRSAGIARFLRPCHLLASPVHRPDSGRLTARHVNEPQAYR